MVGNQGRSSGLMRYGVITGGLIGFFLLTFLLVEILGVPGLGTPPRRLLHPGIGAAALAVGLLAVDALLPVPASLVMLALGAGYGSAIGTLLALAGRTAMTLTAFGIGRSGSRLVARLVPMDGRARADGLLDRWGAMAIVITRPVPLVSETVAILAGTSKMTWSHAALAALAGSLPEAALYASAGATARADTHGAVLWAALLVLSGLFWLLGGRWR